MDSRVEKLADVMVRYSLSLKKGDWLKLQGTPLALPLFKAVYRKALEIGANTFYVPVIDDFVEMLLKYGSDAQIKFIPDTLKYEIDHIDALLSVMGFENTRFLSNADSSKQALLQMAKKPLMETILRRGAEGDLRWCGTGFPIHSAAQDAEMSISEYEDFVYNAGALNLEDPVSHWKEVSRTQAEIVKFLDTKSTFRIVAQDTDLKFNAKGRKWINCDGKENFPDGEVFTGPVEDSVDGKIRYTFPACYSGREVLNVRLTFKEGKVVDFAADKNEEFLSKMLDLDMGARYVGEIAIGTNYNITQFTRNTLFDEKIGGTCHLAVGKAYPETGSKNESALHWDMVCDLRKGGEIYADDQLIYKDGKFLRKF